MWSCLLLTIAAAPFSGVDLDHLLDQPYVQATTVAELTPRQLAALPGVKPVAEPAGGVAVEAKDWTADLSFEAAAGTLALTAHCLAPGRGSDSFWVVYDGVQQPSPFVLPTDDFRDARHPLKVAQPGSHTIQLKLREGTGVVLTALRVEQVGYVPPDEPMKPELAQAHPRLFLTADELPALRARAESELGRKFFNLRGTELSAPRPYDAKKRTCGGYRDLANYALAELLQPDERRLKGISQWVETALEYPEWGHGTLADLDLDAAYMMEGLALAYDWVGDRLPPDLRDRLRDNLAEHCRRVYAASLGGRTGGGLSFQQNHYWYAHSVLMLGAAAIYGEVPEARTWLGWAWDRFERVFLTLGDDGGFHEQPAYWDFSMPPLFAAIGLYESCTGLPIPHGDEGLKQAAVYRLHNVFPGLSETAPFGDTPIHHHGPPIDNVLWLAQRFHDPIAQGIAFALCKGPTPRWSGLLYLDDTLNPADAFATVPTAHRYADIQMAFLRTSWETEATWLGFISRPLGGEKYAELCARYPLGGTGHNHPAQNHFMLFARGEVLAADPGYTYRKMAANHNTVLVDGKGQLGDGEMWPRPNAGRAHLTGFIDDGEVRIVSGEAASAYPDDLQLTRFARTIVMVGRDLVVVCDRLESEVEHRYQWRLHHYGEVAGSDRHWRVTRGQAQLDIAPVGPARFSGKAFGEKPVYVHPSRDQTPKEDEIGVVELTSEPARNVVFLVPLLISDAGQSPAALRPLSGDHWQGVQVGTTVVAFRSGEGTLRVPLASGKVRESEADTLVAATRAGQEQVTEHRLER